MPDDYFAIDKEGSAETNRISKANLFEGYLETPDLEQVYPTKSWARRGGQWIEIFPDYYLVEANKDGKLYARKDGQWVVIGEDGLNGDMYAFTYDQRGQRTDIFDLIQKESQQSNLAIKTIINGNTKLIGNFLNGQFIFKEGLKNFSYVDNPNELKVLEKVKIFKSKNDIFADKSFTFGTYSNGNIENRTKSLKTIFCTSIEKGQTLKLKNIGNNSVKIDFVETDQTNKFLNYLTVSINGQNTTSTIFSDEAIVTFLKTGFFGIECSFGEVQENGEFIVLESMAEDWSDSYGRYKIPLLGSLDNNISITEINVSKETAPELPIKIDLLQNKITSYLKIIQLPYDSWTFENNANGYVTAYAKLPKNSNWIYISGYETVKEINLINNSLQCAIKAIDGENYVYIVTEDSNMYNQEFSLDVYYQDEEESAIETFSIEDGSYQLVAQSVYADSNAFGNFIIDQSAAIDYFLRKSGGEISGDLKIEGNLEVNSKILAETIESFEHQNSLKLTDKIALESLNNDINFKGQNILIESNLNTKIKANNLNIESTERPVINNQEVLIEHDFVVDQENSNQKNWYPQVKTAENFGNRKNIVNEEYLNIFFAPKDGQKLIDIGQENKIINYSLDNISGRNISIKENLKMTNESSNRVVILDENKNVTTSEVTKEELKTLSGINTLKSLQAQLDSIPKYNYLTGQTIVVQDENISAKLPPDISLENATQAQIDKAILDYAKEILDLGSLFEITYIPKQWDAIALRLERQNLETFKDSLFFYDQNSKWTFLYYLSTTINRADGNQAGIVEDSPDISWVNGQGQVAHAEAANKWTNKRNIEINGFLSGSTEVDGSKDILIELDYNYQDLSLSTDLNTLNTSIYSGLYKTPSKEISSSIINSPTAELFELEISDNGIYLKQKISSANSVKQWIRFFIENVWTEWKELINESSGGGGDLDKITIIRGRVY